MNKTTKASLLADLAMLLEHDRCVPINDHDVTSLQSGTFPRARLRSLVTTMQKHKCGWQHATGINPKNSVHLATLPITHFKVFEIGNTKDAVFHAFLQGLSFIHHGHDAAASTLKVSTAKLRMSIVRKVLETKALYTAMSEDPSRKYRRQFEVRAGTIGKMAFTEYTRKMATNAFGSYTELAALSRFSGFEIHIYRKRGDEYAYEFRYKPTNDSRKKRYVMRLLRTPRKTIDHFDLLVPTPFFKHHFRGFWDVVNRVLLGKLGGNAANSPEKALALLNQSQKNARMKLSNDDNDNGTVNWASANTFVTRARQTTPNTARNTVRNPNGVARPKLSSPVRNSPARNAPARNAPVRNSPARRKRDEETGEEEDDEMTDAMENEVRNALRRLARNG
jgi:hypothetical protein